MFPKISYKVAGLSAIAASLAMLFSMLVFSFYTDNFQLFGSWLSDLGTGNYGRIFNLFLILSAVLLVPFGIYLYRALGRKEYIRIAFLIAALSLVFVGIFDGNFFLHKPVAYVFFFSAAASLFFAGWRIKNSFGNLTIVLVLWCLAGIPFLNPFIETVQAFVAIAWLFATGALVLRNRLKSDAY